MTALLLPPRWWPTEAEVDDAIARGVVLWEERARVDLARAKEAKPDRWWARRWLWSVEDVATLRGGVGWRERAALPSRGRR